VSSTEHGGGIYSRQNFLSIYIPAMTLAVGTGIVVPALPVYAKSFGVSFEVASLVIIVHQLGITVSSFPVGLLIDRIGRRKVLLTGPALLIRPCVGNHRQPAQVPHLLPHSADESIDQ